MPTDSQSLLQAPLTADEIFDALRAMKKKAAVGVFGINVGAVIALGGSE